MTDDELKAIEAEALGDCSQCMALVVEVRRLRGLVKNAEWQGPALGRRSYSCPWCDAAFAPDEDAEPHRDICPAFALDGSVR